MFPGDSIPELRRHCHSLQSYICIRSKATSRCWENIPAVTASPLAVHTPFSRSKTCLPFRIPCLLRDNAPPHSVDGNWLWRLETTTAANQTQHVHMSRAVLKIIMSSATAAAATATMDLPCSEFFLCCCWVRYAVFMLLALSLSNYCAHCVHFYPVAHDAVQRIAILISIAFILQS